MSGRLSTYGNAAEPAYFPGGVISPPIPGGSIFYVDGTNGSDSNGGYSPQNALKTVSAALALCTADHHDTIYVIPSDTGVLENTAIDWNKDYTDLIGMGPVRQVSNRARIVCNAAGAGMSPFFTVSAHGCLFSNVMFWQGQANASTLQNVSVTGVRNRFEYVHFAGGGDATQAVDGGASLVLADGAAENEFERCTVGVDTIDASTGLAGLLFSGTAGTCARNAFVKCRFTLHAAGTTPTGVRFVEVTGNASIDRYQVFEDCLFVNLATSVTSAFVLGAGMDAANKRILLQNCSLIGGDDWDSGNTGILYLNNGTITGGGNAGLFAVSNST